MSATDTAPVDVASLRPGDVVELSWAKRGSRAAHAHGKSSPRGDARARTTSTTGSRRDVHRRPHPTPTRRPHPHLHAQIADRLHLAEDTIKSHVKAVLAAIGAQSRTEAAALVLTGQVWVDGITPDTEPPAGKTAPTVPFTASEAATARDLWRELGRQPYASATPEQLLGFMRKAPEHIGLKYAARIIEAQQAEAHCFQADHEVLVGEFWAREQAAAEARAAGAAA